MYKRTVQLFGTRFIVVRGPPWTYKKPIFPILKRYHLPKPFSLGPDKKLTPLGQQQYKFMKAAYNAQGTTGKVTYKGVLMPAIAAKIASEISGSTLAGKQPAKERDRVFRHKKTAQKIQKYQKYQRYEQIVQTPE